MKRADPAYIVDLPDIHEIMTSADTLGRGFDNAREALDLHLERLQKLNLPMPRRRHCVVVEAA